MTDLLDYPAAAARLGVSKRYLQQLVARGAIAHHRLGRRVLFSPADLEAFVRASRVGAGDWRLDNLADEIRAGR